MKLTLIALAGAGTCLAACAPYSMPSSPHYGPPGVDAVAVAPAPGVLGPGQCFRTRDIRNHTVADDRTVFLKVSNRGVYRVEMTGACLAGATSSDPLIMRQPPGSAIVCRPLDLDVSIDKGGFASPCIVGGITRLTPPEVAALPPRMRP